jgi:hypothetical protein
MGMVAAKTTNQRAIVFSKDDANPAEGARLGRLAKAKGKESVRSLFSDVYGRENNCTSGIPNCPERGEASRRGLD